MATIYVRTTGNDTTGDGTMATPFRTVGKAISTWVDNDVVDVGVGNFSETIEWTITVPVGTIRGKGHDKTFITANIVGGKLINVDDGSVTRVLVQECMIDQGSLGLNLLDINDCDAAARFIWARCVLLIRDGHAVEFTSTNDGVRIDVLNCVISSNGSAQQGIAFHAVEANVITARNCIFNNLKLIVDDSGGGAPQDSNFNNYFNCERLFRTGSLGDQDLRDVDPRFVAVLLANFRLLGGSKMRNAGVDLNDGYGAPTRLPPPELNWLFNGKFPDLGVEEVIFPSGSTIAQKFNIHLILQVFAEELLLVVNNQREARLSRFLETAPASELSRRWGALLGAFRPSDMTQAEYKELIEDLLTLYQSVAPAIRSQNQIIQTLFNAFPAREDYHSSRRFPLSADLKLTAVTPPGLTVNLTAGQFQIERYWFRAVSTNLVLPINNVSIIYSDGVTFDDDIKAVIKQSVDLSLRVGHRIDTLVGTAVFEKDSTTVIGTGTAFKTALEPLKRIRAGGTKFFYVIDKIVSDVELVLRRAFAEDDVADSVELLVPLEIFGEVTTDATSITDIKSQGRLSASAFLNSAETKGHGYHLVIDDGGTESIFSTTERVVLLKALLCKAKPVHKLGFLSFILDTPQGVVSCADVAPFTQSAVNYLEDWEDSTWPAP